MKFVVSVALASAAFAGIVLTASATTAAFPSAVTSLMDTSVSPCDDFYQYTCGSWLKSTTLAASESKASYSYGAIAKRNDVVVQEIVKQGLPILSEFWDSCMNLDKLTALGGKPLHATLRKISAVTSKHDLFKVAGEIAKTGPSFFTSFSVGIDPKNVTMNELSIGSVDTILDATKYATREFPKYEAALRKYISTMLSLAGFEKLDLAVAQKAVIGIEMELVKIQTSIKALSRKESTVRIKYSDAAVKYPLAFGQIASGFDILGKSKLTPSSAIMFESLQHVDRVESMLQRAALTDLQIYLSFVYTAHYAQYLGEPFLQARFDFRSTTATGATTRSLRNAVCTAHATELLPDLIGKYYVAKMFDFRTEDATKHMVALVKGAMDEHIQQLAWLDAATKAEAAKKLAKVLVLIGRSAQTETFAFTLDRSAFFDNVEKIQMRAYSALTSKFGNPVDRTEWEDSPVVANAYYTPWLNQVMLPAGILQPPMLNSSNHPAQNFAAIGTTIGHEITHGFDSSGRRYDGNGNYKNWWTSAASDAFDTRAKCMREQYNTFVVRGENGTALMHVNGSLTLGENIADNGGLSLAFDAFQKYMQSPKAIVPTGTKLSDTDANKLFFIAFGQKRCSKSRDKAMKEQLTTDSHAADLWRVNGVVMNSEVFAKTFQCKAGAKMNPTKKCVLW